MVEAFSSSKGCDVPKIRFTERETSLQSWDKMSLESMFQTAVREEDLLPGSVLLTERRPISGVAPFLHRETPVSKGTLWNALGSRFVWSSRL
jgi:hypothetical protein